MQIDTSTVDQIAKLAKLTFSDEEKKVMADQLSTILGYVETLQQVNTDDVSETNQVTEQIDILRPDEVHQQPQAVNEALLAAAPAKEGRGIQVGEFFL